ncbi:hypothetical protein D3C84_934930 [compost metagenome]
MAWRWALTWWLNAVLSGNWCLSCNELGRRRVRASLAGLSVDSGKAETDEFMIWLPGRAAGSFPRAGPSGVFDNWPDWPAIEACHR